MLILFITDKLAYLSGLLLQNMINTGLNGKNVPAYSVARYEVECQFTCKRTLTSIYSSPFVR